MRTGALTIVVGLVGIIGLGLIVAAAVIFLARLLGMGAALAIVGLILVGTAGLLAAMMRAALREAARKVASTIAMSRLLDGAVAVAPLLRQTRPSVGLVVAVGLLAGVFLLSHQEPRD